MKKGTFIYLILVVNAACCYSQFDVNKTLDDAPKIEIVKDSIIDRYTEVFETQDSLWYSFYYKEDTACFNSDCWSKKTFEIDKIKALKHAKRKGLKSNKQKPFFFMECVALPNKDDNYYGRFLYHIVEYTDEVVSHEGDNGGYLVVYKIYSFDLSSGQYVGKKKARNERALEELWKKVSEGNPRRQGINEGLVPD